MADISYKNEIADEYFDKYRELTVLKEKLDWVDDDIKQHEDTLQSLQIEKRRLELDSENVERKIEEYKETQEKLDNLSWKSIKSKLLRNHQEEVETTQLKREQAEQQLNSLEKRLERINTRIQSEQEEIHKLEEANQKKDVLDAKITEVIYDAVDGFQDEQEDAIEMRISELGVRIDPLTVRKSRIQTAYSMLQMAAEYLREASIRIEEESNKKAEQNALLVETLTKSEVAELKQVVKDASSVLDEAYEIMMKEIINDEDRDGDGEHSGLFEGQSTIWQKFIKDLMKDLKSGFRTKEQTKLQLSKAVGDINKLMSWVNSLLTDINFRIAELMDELEGREQDLIRERKRIFQEQYGKTQGL